MRLPCLRRFAGLSNRCLVSERFLSARGCSTRNPDTNWLVPWHQDLTIRVRERREVAGYGPWSRKDGVDHVQPPVAVLENMLAVRIHLDPADSNNGGLGRISADRVDELALSLVPKPCDANRGDLLPVRRVNRIVVMLSEDL